MIPSAHGGRSGALFLVFALCFCLLTAAAQQPLTAGQREEIQRFRDRQTAIMKGPQSALGMVALEHLREGDSSVGSAAESTIRLDHTAPQLCILRQRNGELSMLPTGSFAAGFTADGKTPDAGPVHFNEEGTSPTYRNGSVSFVLRHKFGFYLVGRDTQAPELLAFHGLRWYPPDARYRIVAKWFPYPQPRTLRIRDILGHTNDELSYGVAEFAWQGRTIRVEPTVRKSADYPLFLVFRDTTSQVDTYQAGRFLDIAMPDHGLTQAGTVVLDFNRARNPLCAFSPHTSCPLPLPQNRLSVAIAAGEKRYR